MLLSLSGPSHLQREYNYTHLLDLLCELNETVQIKLWAQYLKYSCPLIHFYSIWVHYVFFYNQTEVNHVFSLLIRSLRMKTHFWFRMEFSVFGMKLKCICQDGLDYTVVTNNSKILKKKTLFLIHATSQYKLAEDIWVIQGSRDMGLHLNMYFHHQWNREKNELQASYTGNLKWPLSFLLSQRTTSYFKGAGMYNLRRVQRRKIQVIWWKMQLCDYCNISY